MDVSWRSLETTKERLSLDELPEHQWGRIELIQGSLTYRDQRLNGFEAAAIVEAIEHLDAPILATFERIVFEFATPGVACIRFGTAIEPHQCPCNLSPDPQIAQIGMWIFRVSEMAIWDQSRLLATRAFVGTHQKSSDSSHI